MAALLQYLVFCKGARKLLFNWRICAVNLPTFTFCEFFAQQLEKESSVFNRRLDFMFVGQSKEDCTSKVDKNLSVLAVAINFTIMDNGNNPPARIPHLEFLMKNIILTNSGLINGCIE